MAKQANSKSGNAAPVTKNVPAAAKSTAVSTEVATFQQDAGGGFEQADARAYAIPFLAVLQSNSPQCKKSDEAAYIKGAQEGMLIDTVTMELFDVNGDNEKNPGGPLRLICCAYIPAFIEWKVRGEGGSGGFVMAHDVATGLAMLKTSHKNDKGHDILSNGNQLVDTRQHYVMRIDDEDQLHPMVFSLSSTQIKKSKRWMTAMQNIKLDGAHGKFTPPMYASIFQVTTAGEKNDKGAWMGVQIEHERMLDLTNPVEQGWYAACKAFTASVLKGEVKVQDQGEAASATDGGGDVEDELDK